MSIPFIRLLSLLSLFSSVTTKFHPHFKQFLISTYGWYVAEQLERNDLPGGSYGGGPTSGNERALIFVHGLNSQVMHMDPVRYDFIRFGRSEPRIFGTTYGSGDGNFLDPKFIFDSAKCEYIKQVRAMIVSVTLYTQQSVDIVSYSMGAPIARKAIMGGRCVDTNEDLGGTLDVNIFLSVAGANYGLGVCALPIAGVCNAETGLYCQSKLIQDINSRHGYEGKKVIQVWSDIDSVVGTNTVCGYNPNDIQGSQKVMLQGKSHRDAIYDTSRLQFALLS